MKEPVFSKANGNELWVLIMEKAWAKLHGSYQRIEAGNAANVMHDLTGAPAETIDIEDETMFDRLLEGEKKNYIMAASCGTNETSLAALEKLGLIGGHAYGLLSAH